MDSNITAAIIAVAGVLITAVVSYSIGRRNYHKENLQEVAIELWKNRLTQYQELMKLMIALPLYPSKAGDTNWGNLEQLSKDLRQWYFNGGGLLLTTESRKKYSAIQEHILDSQAEFSKGDKLSKCKIFKYDKENVEKKDKKKDEEKDNAYSVFQSMLSDLRTELTNDLTSRDRGLLIKK